MIEDDIATLRTAVANLAGGDEREKYATANLDFAEQLLAQARAASRDTTGAGAAAVATARGLIDLTAIVLADPAKSAPAPERAAGKRK